jgi:hypothetical protein
VAGTVALMIQANPALSPNLVKAILQYTAEHKARYNHLTQGAGFLNARGAVQLAKIFAKGANQAPGSAAISDPTPWNRHINWGNQRIGGGVLRPDANAWATQVIWGSARTDDGAPIVWGSVCRDKGCDTSSWSTAPSDDTIAWAASQEDNIVWGTTAEDTIVWGTSEAEDNIVWGTAVKAGTTIVRDMCTSTGC